MSDLRRRLGVIAAIALLAVAALHGFAHVGSLADSDDGCAVCAVQHAGALSAPVPRVVAVAVPSFELAEAPASRAASRPVLLAGARAPPSRPA